MSELKRHHINEVMDMHNLTRGKMGYSIVYYADDADKVIAEKDEAIAELKDKLQNVSELLKETREWLIESQKMHKRCADNAIKKLRHHKYKRCLAMADMCSEALCYWDNVKYTFFKGEAYCFRKMNHYGKWGQIWLAISEKFKEAK